MKNRSLVGLGTLMIVLAGIVLAALSLRLVAAESNPTAPVDNAIPRDTSVAAAFFTGYSYQGYIEKSDQPYTGNCDFSFELMEMPTIHQTFNNVPVDGGHFSVVLDGVKFSSYNGLFSLDVSAACPSGGALIPLATSQAVMPVPYAKGLVPGTVLRSPDGGGCSLMNHNVRSDTWVLIACDPQGLRGAVPSSRGGGSETLINLGGLDYESNTFIVNGLDVASAYRGLWARATTIGFEIQDSIGIGGIIRRTGLDGLFIDRAGRNGIYISSPMERGIAIVNAGGTALGIWDPAGTGVYISEPKDAGVDIRNSDKYGIYVDGSTSYDGVFQGSVYVGGTCTGCTLANMGVNVSDEELDVGTLVTISGVIDSAFTEASVLLQVRRAQPGEPIIGIVMGAAEAQTGSMLELTVSGAQRAVEQEAVPSMSLVLREGDVAPGGYLTIVRDGLVRVKVDSADITEVVPGARLMADGATVTGLVESAMPGDLITATPVSIGVAMSAPDDEGYVWAMISLR